MKLVDKITAAHAVLQDKLNKLHDAQLAFDEAHRKAYENATKATHDAVHAAHAEFEEVRFKLEQDADAELNRLADLERKALAAAAESISTESNLAVSG